MQEGPTKVPCTVERAPGMRLVSRSAAALGLTAGRDDGCLRAQVSPEAAGG